MNLPTLLRQNRELFHPLFAPDLSTQNTLLMDLSHTNPEMKSINFRDAKAFNAFVFDKISSVDCLYGYGGYLEDREVYRRSSLFAGSGGQPRSIHLGIDVWAEAATTVFAPMDSTIHSFRDNDNYGDYGPTIILEHKLSETTFFTLYGHLSRVSLQGLEEGGFIKAGAPFCDIGPFPENGDWPPHLHFQVIANMADKNGDFFGVCQPDEKKQFASLCPDPVVFFKDLFKESQR